MAAFLERRYGAVGALFGITIGGFADTHSAGASAAALQAKGALSMHSAQLGVMLAMTANTVSKLLVAQTTGGWGFVRATAPALLVMLAALWVVTLALR
jgi:uncharacterized membrane protein (DUF4010 family)